MTLTLDIKEVLCLWSVLKLEWQSAKNAPLYLYSTVQRGISNRIYTELRILLKYYNCADSKNLVEGWISCSCFTAFVDTFMECLSQT